LGVPRGGYDFIYGDAFPHEPTWTSCTASISTRAVTSDRKSCRGCSIAAPRAPAWCRFSTAPARPGLPVTAGDKPVGTMGSSANGRNGLALLRLDRVADALEPDAADVSGGPSACIAEPGWARFAWPGRPKPCHEPSALHPDGLTRCPWPGEDPLYVAYHDTEWGVPEYDDRALYEKLILDGFQAGLSWITILRKRENFRRAFDDLRRRRSRAIRRKKFTR
jgi:hypothetical protein